MPSQDQVTRLLIEMAAGDSQAHQALLDLVYDELRQMARRHRAQWRRSPVGTLSLVHEAYMKLVDQTHVQWQSRGQFFAIASRAMRSVLVDNARHWQRLKREGGRERVELNDALLVSEARGEELLALDAALAKLQQADARLGAIVECRFFGGLTVEETADALDLSPATVKRDWVAARTLLYRELRDKSPDEPSSPAISS